MDGHFTYALRVTNGSGTAPEATHVVTVSAQPLILSFSAQPTELTAGDAVTFSWTTEDGANGDVAALTLKDQLGHVHDLGAADPRDGSATMELATAGNYVFTLAAGPGDDEFTARRQAQVAVLVRPAISLATATPSFADYDEQEIQLQWQTQGGSSLEVFQLDQAGAIVGGAVCTVGDVGQIASGGCGVKPTRLKPDFRIRVANRLGASVERLVEVGVAPARILTFTATDASGQDVAEVDLLEGESTTLKWTTNQHTDTAELGPRFREGTAPFIDVRNHARGKMAKKTNGDRSTMGFLLTSDPNERPQGEPGLNPNLWPEGFKFPFFGREITRAYVCAKGNVYLNGSFTDCESNSPSGTWPKNGQQVNLLPFYALGVGPQLTPETEESAFWYVDDQDPVTGKRYLVIQWRNFRFGIDPKGNLDFEVVLHEDGVFEYRYREMTRAVPGDDQQGDADGAVAVIGYQSNDLDTLPKPPNHFYFHPVRSAWPGGLSGKSFTFYPDVVDLAGLVDPSGSKTVTPRMSTTISLIARNDHSGDEKTVRFNLFKPAALGAFSTDPLDPAPGRPFALTWSGSELTSLTVMDQNDNVLFSSIDASTIASGRAAIPAGLPAGDYTLKFTAVGNLSRDEKTGTFPLAVYPAYSLDDFVTDQPRITLGQTANLSWSSSGLTSLVLEPSVGAPITLAVDATSYAATPTQTTTYTLKGLSYGRPVQRAVTVEVRTATVESFATSASVVFQGGSAQLTWTATGTGTITITGAGGAVLYSGAVGAASSFDVSPTQRETYEICVTNATWTECQEVTIGVLKAGSILITELMVAPTGGASSQWFEVRNVGTDDVDLRGLTIVSTDGGAVSTHTIASENGVLVPKNGGYLVLSAAPMAEVANNYVYGAGIALGTTGSPRSIGLGSTTASANFASVTFTGFTFVNGKSLELSGTAQNITNALVAPSNDASKWCTAVAPLGGDFGTPGKTGPSCGGGATAYYDVDPLSSLSFIDLRDFGNSVHLTKIEGAVYWEHEALPVGMPFSFPFFGDTIAKDALLWATSFGCVTFADPGFDDYMEVKPYLPYLYSTPLQGVLAPFWSWMTKDASGAGSVLVNKGTFDGKQVVAVQWSEFRAFYVPNIGSTTFQVQLWENGDIVFAYGALSGSPIHFGGDGFSQDALVGIESVGASEGYQYLRNHPILRSGQSILFKRK